MGVVYYRIFSGHLKSAQVVIGYWYLPSLSGGAFSLCGFQQNAEYEHARRTREWCVCIVRVDGGAICSGDVNRMRCANSQDGREGVCVCAVRVARV